MFDDAAITRELESNNLLDKHSFNNWTGQGMTEINPTTDISNGQHQNNKYIYNLYMSVDAEKWDNDIEYAYEKLIEREKEKGHNISNNKYECNCGKEVLNKGKEEHESND